MKIQGQWMWSPVLTLLSRCALPNWTAWNLWPISRQYEIQFRIGKWWWPAGKDDWSSHSVLNTSIDSCIERLKYPWKVGLQFWLLRQYLGCMAVDAWEWSGYFRYFKRVFMTELVVKAFRTGLVWTTCTVSLWNWQGDYEGGSHPYRTVYLNVAF